MITKALSDYIDANGEGFRKLFEANAEEAALILKNAGCDVTSDELSEFATELKAMKETGKSELSETDLDNEAGGSAVSMRMLLSQPLIAYYLVKSLWRK